MTAETKTCSSCEAPIIWAKTDKGKAIPMDADPVPDGEWCIMAGFAKAPNVVRAADAPHGTPRYRTHFATCPNARMHRSRQAK